MSVVKSAAIAIAAGFTYSAAIAELCTLDDKHQWSNPGPNPQSWWHYFYRMVRRSWLTRVITLTVFATASLWSHHKR